ncbi:MAG: hypothetical protein KDC92_00755 [Bacteroidetes bacterium]|nr:hypothetical protein [Bacteroidota bacterium]
MKKLSFTLAFGLAILLANAQQLGFSFSRGATMVHSNNEFAAAPINQGYAASAYLVRLLPYDFKLTSGIQFSQLYTGGAVKNATNQLTGIPESFCYFELPVVFEKDFYIIPKEGKKATFLRLGAGLSLAYDHNNVQQQIVRGKAPSNSSDLDYGSHLSLQWVKPVTLKSEIAMGLHAKSNTTSSDNAPFISFIGAKIDLRFIN